ncbi:VCBS repeat-containing protein [Archangium sp.]|uniref:VCBS repeat-containing protein n=1 Tax=Archangium sp. TaxID=1872627 RepID=UPI002D3B6A79|nr:VCBS repeat-containing protein [Archangium sp.]HYO56661.1 VCBS repeat-containing protein [Archangium sp.]
MSRALAAALLLSALSAPAAQPPPPQSAPAAPSTSAAPALERLAQAVAADVRAMKPEPPVALSLSGGAPELRRAFGTLLASRLASAGLAPVVLEAPSPEAAESLAREQGTRALVRLTLGVEAGELRAHGDAFGTWVNFWSGRTATRAPSPAAAIAQAVEADAAALALAAVEPPSPRTPAATPEESRPPRLLGAVLARLPSPPAALAAGDLDGDGRDEVVALTERSVHVFTAEGSLVAERSLDVLPPGPAPTREPFGALAILSGPPRIAAASTRFAHGEVLALENGSLRFVSRLEAVPLGPDARGGFVPGQTAFAPEVRLGNGEQRLTGVPARFTTFSSANSRLLLVHPDGSASFFARPSVAPVPLSGLGAGSALGDLDGDGTPELLTTSPELQPSPDVLRVFKTSGSAPTAHEPLWQGPLPAGRALHVVTANLDGDKRREVVVGLTRPDGTGELFLLRQGVP